MKRLGEMLLERGSIAVAELRTGLEACHQKGGRLGTHLLKFNFVDERALLEALSDQLDVPSVSISVLRGAPDALRRMVPLPEARRLQVMVFDRQAGNLSVAMTTPRSPAVLEKVVSHVGLNITPHVATEIAIMTALSEIREEAAPSLSAPGNSRRGAVDLDEIDPVCETDLEEWQSLWSPPALQSMDLLRRRRGPLPEQSPLAATFPGHETIRGTREPPSWLLPLPARRG